MNKRLLGISGLVALLFAIPIAMQGKKNSVENKINHAQKSIESKSEPKFETQDEEGVFELMGFISNSKGETYTRKALLKFKGRPTKWELKDFDNDGDLDILLEGYITENNRESYGTFVSENDGKGNYFNPKLIKPSY